METNMKIDVEKSLIYRFDDRNDLSQAVLLLGVKGYFSNDKDFSDYTTGTLIRVCCWLEKIEYPFVCGNGKPYEIYKYFIPDYIVVFKEESKKENLRPFKSIEEFYAETGFIIGEIIQIKRVANCSYEEKTILNGFRVHTDDEFHRIDIIFGSGSRTLGELFKYYEYLKNGKWLRFGVEE